MKKRRLLYSQLALADTPRRVSSPVDLARTLAAAGAADGASAPPPVRASPAAPRTERPFRERALSRSGLADLLMFRAGIERFAVELRAVEEVVDAPVVHHVPGMPPAMLGVVALRDSLTPVYSPHGALGLPLALREAALIFRRGRARVGILVDDVEDAISIDLGELRDAPGARQVDSVTLGVVRHGEWLVSLVDADALITACQAAALLETA